MLIVDYFSSLIWRSKLLEEFLMSEDDILILTFQTTSLLYVDNVVYFCFLLYCTYEWDLPLYFPLIFSHLFVAHWFWKHVCRCFHSFFSLNSLIVLLGLWCVMLQVGRTRCPYPCPSSAPSSRELELACGARAYIFLFPTHLNFFIFLDKYWWSSDHVCDRVRFDFTLQIGFPSPIYIWVFRSY